MFKRFCSTAFRIMSEKRPKVIVTDHNIPQSAVEIMETWCDVKVIKEEPSATRKTILANIKGADALFWITKEKLDVEVLDTAGPQMKVIGTMSAGIDHIDVQELKKRGIKLGNTPQVLDGAVADCAVLLALAASRRMREGRLAIENKQWLSTPNWLLGQDIVGSTVGVVGLGGIGQAIVKRLKAFQVGKFLYSGHKEKPEGIELGAEFVPFDTILEKSDFIIAACPLTSETKGMFNKETFGKMKNTAVFVNIARGGLVDQPALIEALKNNTIFAAGLDVMTPEPLPPDHELLKLPNCVLIPHLGSATIDTRKNMAELTAQNILRGLGNAEMITPVC